MSLNQVDLDRLEDLFRQVSPTWTSPVGAVWLTIPQLITELESYRRADSDNARDDETAMAMLRDALGTRDVHGEIDGIERLVKQRDALRDEVAELEQQRETDERTWAAEWEGDCSKELHALANLCGFEPDEETTADDMGQAIRAELDALRARAAELEEQRDTLRAELSDAQTNLRFANETNRMVLSERDGLRAELEALRARVKELESRQPRIEEQEKDYAGMREFQGKTIDLTHQLNTAKAGAAGLRAELAALRAERDRLRAEVVETQLARDRYKNELMDLDGQVDFEREKLTAANAELGSLRLMLKSGGQDIAKIRFELADERRKLAELSEANSTLCGKLLAAGATIAGLREALEEIDTYAAAKVSTGSCGVLGGHWAECDICGGVSRARTEPIPHENECPAKVARAAIARTPSQHRAAIEAGALREAEKLLRDKAAEKDDPSYDAAADVVCNYADKLQMEAERREKEAGL